MKVQFLVVRLINQVIKCCTFAAQLFSIPTNLLAAVRLFNDDATLSRTDYDFLKINGFGTQPQNHTIEIMRNVPHARTLRNAREQVHVMIYYGISTQHIRHYLNSWARWWMLTIESWSYPEILARLIDSCWETNLHVAAMAEGLRQRYLKKIVVQDELEVTPL